MECGPCLHGCADLDSGGSQHDLVQHRNASIVDVPAHGRERGSPTMARVSETPGEAPPASGSLKASENQMNAIEFSNCTQVNQHSYVCTLTTTICGPVNSDLPMSCSGYGSVNSDSLYFTMQTAQGQTSEGFVSAAQPPYAVSLLEATAAG